MLIVEVAQVPVPSAAWGTLHNKCSWMEFAHGCGQPNVVEQLIHSDTGLFDFHIVMCVDWHAALAWRRICESVHLQSVALPWVFLSYRMFSRDETSLEVRSVHSSVHMSIFSGCLPCSSIPAFHPAANSVGAQVTDERPDTYHNCR